MFSRIKILVGISGLVVVVLGLALFTQSSYLDIDEFKVEGNSKTPSQDIIAISGLKVGDQLFPINLSAASKSVRRLPWVKEANISRGLDGLISFKVTERQARVVAFSRQGFALLDVEGRVLEILGSEGSCESHASQSNEIICIANLIVPSEPGNQIRERNLPLIQIAEQLHTINKCLRDITVAGCPEGETTSLYFFVRQIVLHSIGEVGVSLQLRGGGWVFLGDPNTNLELEGKLRNLFNLLTKEDSCVGENFCASRDLCGDAVLDLAVKKDGAVLTKDKSC